MMITKTNKTKYPYKVVFNNGRVSPIPSQHRFLTEFIRDHGCSIVAFYIALRFLGKKKTMGQVLRWSRKHLKDYLKSKYTIRGISVGIDKVMKSDHATYYSEPKLDVIVKALNRDSLVLLETSDPIHTNVLFRGNGETYYNASDGKVKKIDLEKIVRKATKSKIYKGCVIVR